MSLREFLRRSCPDFLFIKKLISRVEIRKYTRYLLQPKDIILGETSEEGRNAVLKKYTKKWPEYIKNCNNDVDNILKKTSLALNMRDNILFYLLAYGFKPEEYLSYRLWEKSKDECSQYISNIECMCYVYRMNDVIDSDLLHDKWKTYEKFAPKFRREVICVCGEKDYGSLCEFVDKHNIFITKRADLLKGNSVELVDIDQVNLRDKNSFDKFFLKGKYLLEERIVQGRELALFHSSSVNTVRCATFNTKSGIKIGFCFLRVGRGSSIVDNGGAGGIEIGIDLDTGCLNSDGYDYYGNVFTKHPDSGIVFNGYQLPQWNQVISMCKEMAAELPKVRFIGWDMAFSEKGWCLVEGNHAAAMRGPQICGGKGIKSKVEAFMSDMDLLA